MNISKIYAPLRDWITEDIGHRIDIKQFAGKKGVGTEHMIVWMVDRVLWLLDQPGSSTVFSAAVNWNDAFSRTDPTLNIQGLIDIGCRLTLVSIIIEFLEDRKMSTKYNQEKSELFELIGGSPQGSWGGQNCSIVSSDDNASFVNQKDRLKYCDNLSILELLFIGKLSTEYNFHEHVASRLEQQTPKKT